MVPGTRPKKQKLATKAAANQEPPRTPTRLTRQSAAMPSPGGRPPPKIRHPLPPKYTSKANPKPPPVSSTSQLQAQLTTSSSQTNQTTSTVPTHPIITRTGPAMSSPLPNIVPSPRKFTRQTAAKPMAGANPAYHPSVSTATLSHQPTPNDAAMSMAGVAMSSPLPNIVPSPPRQTAARSTPSPNPSTLSREPTPTTSVNQVLETSPGAQSSRQSNDLNESVEQFGAATSEGHIDEGERVGDLVPGKQYVLPNIIFSIQYDPLLLL